jgi:methyl-accepting chemotaxis protein
MDSITDSANNSKDTTTTMLSKYEETARNVINIEMVVGKLIEELGTGGFMSLEDVTPGMKVSMITGGSDTELYSEVVEVVDDHTICVRPSGQSERAFETGGKYEYQVQIIVNNAIYIWENIKLEKSAHLGAYVLYLKENPKVMNRRKYPRLPMKNACEIILLEKDKTFAGSMVNISAGGFAFACRADEFAEVQGQSVAMKVDNFPLLHGQYIQGVVIRSSNDAGTYIVGCRMMQDNRDIEEYVKLKM